MDANQKAKILMKAFTAIASLLILYFVIVSAISGFKFALSQFQSYWYFLVSLALGFGIQIGLYSYLKQLVKNNNMGKTVAVTGTTSTLAMISCCAHYLANVVPVLGIAGALSVVAAYQVQIFWVGLLFNIFGVAFISNKIIKFSTQGGFASGGKKHL